VAIIIEDIPAITNGMASTTEGPAIVIGEVVVIIDEPPIISTLPQTSPVHPNS
jgi:hypothetical protein